MKNKIVLLSSFSALILLTGCARESTPVTQGATPAATAPVTAPLTAPGAQSPPTPSVSQIPVTDGAHAGSTPPPANSVLTPAPAPALAPVPAPAPVAARAARPRVDRQVAVEDDRPRYVTQKRSKKKSAAIVGGSAAGGAAIGALAGGGKGAGIGAIIGGVGGLIYDRKTHKKEKRVD